jgi:PAS domain S-box-containing protein
MAKNAEDRYQSALGLKFDLENCLRQLKETGKIESFAIAQQDVCDRFIISDKLYGRETEITTLLEAFERVSLGATEMMLVAGFSGIGKTAVVNEVHKPIVRQRGYFIKGKFDQFQRNIPFSAFVQAFRNLIGQLLTESDAQIQQWKSKILESLGENGQVIIEVIPELERIIGKQTLVIELSGTASQNRFNLLFQKFTQVFTTAEHPLVMFLDDLQWADSASLKLMELLMADTGHLLLIGAYRDNEVKPAHPLMLTLNDIQKTAVTINTITLTPLSQGQVNQLVADTLKCSEKLAWPLSGLVSQKTQGNPFFATQFLKALHQDGLIEFNLDSGCWQCDITQINERSLTDDIVEFMALQLQKLPESTQSVLKLAACIGNQFDLETLAIVCKESKIETAACLWSALQEGLILPQSEVYKFFVGLENQDVTKENSEIIVYKFLHDRVQQAAYSLIPEAEKQKTHLMIGQLLLQGLSQQEQQERIFDLVNQLNLGLGAIAEDSFLSTIAIDEQKKQLACLNLQAGQKAKLSAAYEASQSYCTTGIDLLPATAWQTEYELMYSLHRDCSEAAYLCGNFDRAEVLYGEALSNAQTPLDKAVIYRVQMTQYQLQGHNAEAIAMQRQSLQLLNWELPKEQELIQKSLDEEIAIVNRFLEQQTVESILNLPKMSDASIAEMLRILQILFYAAWLDGQPTLGLLVLAKMTTLSLQYGNSDMSPFSYAGYALIANAILKDLGIGYQFGEMAVQLCEQFDNADVRGMTNFIFAADVHSWSHPIREADTYYDNAYKYGMEAGNWLTVGFMMMQSGSDRLTYSKNLDELYAIAQGHADFLRHIKSLENLDALIVGVIQPIRNLLGLTKTPFSFDDDSFTEAEFLQKYGNTPYHLAWLYSVKIRHAYLFDHKTAYPDLIPKLSIIENTISSHAKVPSSVFYVALMHLSLAEIASDEQERQFHWQALIPLEERLNNWATACPENILHKCLLILAEKARLKGQKAEALDFYEQAIAQAKHQDYGYEEALANELAAKFYLNWGKEKAARDYIYEAYYCYTRWGAKAKILDLEKRYPQLLKSILKEEQIKLNPLETINFRHASSFTCTNSTGTSNISQVLDFTSVLKAAQAISSSLELDQLIVSLTRILLENSGAKKCVLLLPQEEDNWQVRAITFIKHGEIQTILKSQSLDNCQQIPVNIIYYVRNTQQTIVIDNCKTDIPGLIGEYMLQHQPQSVFCAPIINQGLMVGILYLENSLTQGVFISDRLSVINLLSSQAAISLENAQLYTNLQDTEARFHRLAENVPGMIYQFQLLPDGIASFNYVSTGCYEIYGISSEQAVADASSFISLTHPEDMARFQECITISAQTLEPWRYEGRIITLSGQLKWIQAASRPIKQADGSIIWDGLLLDVTERKQAEAAVIQKSQELKKTLEELQQAQLQVVQSEKMSALGNLVAGIAHEMNNPLGFISASLQQAKPTIADIVEHLKLYQESLPNASDKIKDHAEDIDLDYTLEDLPKIIDSMVMACDRLRNISTSLRTFSRADKDYKVPFNIHEGIDSTILILKHRLKANEERPEIKVVTDYGNLPQVKCFPGQLNQVFMNILANAIDALDEANIGRSFTEIQSNPNQITIKTSLEDKGVKIAIADNGNGISEEVQEKIFDHLFTTKGVGKGTGLGLAIAHQIVVEKHEGVIEVDSRLGKGTEFVIQLSL